MRTPLSKVVRILRLTSHVTRWERSTALMSAVKGLAARERPLQRAASKDDRAQVGAEPEGRRWSSSDARIGYRSSECASGAVPILQRASAQGRPQSGCRAFPCRGSAPACARDISACWRV